MNVAEAVDHNRSSVISMITQYVVTFNSIVCFTIFLNNTNAVLLMAFKRGI